LYSIVLLLMLYDWPHQVYRNLGPRMAAATERERLIVTAVDAYAGRLHLRLTPTFVIGSAPASAGSFSGNAVIVISSAMLNPMKYSDNDVRFILAHEVGHIARLDAYRFWTRWTRGAAAAREIDADRIAVRLVGCSAMRETVMHHWSNFMLGYQEEGDYHPHPNTRLQAVCSVFAGES
jgi:Zn-dependent protease with chaperone function